MANREFIKITEICCNKLNVSNLLNRMHIEYIVVLNLFARLYLLNLKIKQFFKIKNSGGNIFYFF